MRKKRINYIKNMFSILNRAYLPNVNTIKERSKGNGLLASHNNTSGFEAVHKDLKIISNITHNNLSNLLVAQAASQSVGIYRMNTVENAASAIHNKIYDSVGYKNMGGIRLEVKGRLTKRYRADRSIYSLKWKGGLKNIDSSFKGLSSVLFRGNSKSNVTYSITKSKRRIGAFAVKGWIGGK